MSSKKINWNRFKYKINNDFFKDWTPQMAYILGFTYSDGNVHDKCLCWKLSNKDDSDKNLLIKINKTMRSNYPVTSGNTFFRLRISNPIILKDIKNLGIVPNKTKTIKFPFIPERFLRDFIRGYFDGDGWITIRNRKNRGYKEINIGFACGSRTFLKSLVQKLNENLNFSNNNLRKRKKVTKNRKVTYCYQIEYYSQRAMSLIKYLYDDLKDNDLYLQRKCNKQLEARKVYKEFICKTKLWRKIENKFEMPMEKLLYNLLIIKKLDGLQIAKKLNVHCSTIYRLLEKTKLRLPAIRGSKEWVKRIHYKK
ncbi:hypothetical protein KY312_00460 [Candidatus Woesearchaeota archaeon]|nr:hypothetical protein [Candidatus Woesearchaeota archaeon]